MIVKAITTGKSLSPFALLLNPAFWLCIIAWTVFTAYFARDYGAEQERFKQQALTIQALEAQEKAAAKVLAAERQLRTDDTREFLKFKENQAHAEENARIVIADLRSHNRKLRIPIQVGSVCGATANAGGSTAAGPLKEARGELSVEAAEFLTVEAARCDSIARQLNAVIDSYDRVRAAVTQGASTHPAVNSHSANDKQLSREEQSNVRTTP